MKIAYFDCFSGISGDMILGAILDAGLPLNVLLDDFKKVRLGGYSVHVQKEKRGSIAGTRVKISVEHHQPARSCADICSLIEESRLEPRVKEHSLAVFDVLARAEARVHDIPPSRVHFHEVGALDSILDIIGTAAGLYHLGTDRVCASRIPVGRGFVKTQHGVLPVPAPAVVVLLEGVPVYDSGIERELVTPTGAAILAALAESFGPVPDMTLLASGYGTGTHPAENPPNLLRVLIGTARSGLHRKDLLLVETSIDDMNPELYNYVIDQLLALGALDVGLVPVQMKKNRPGILLRALIEPALEAGTVDLILGETTTLGVRIQQVKRVELDRQILSIGTPYGPCRIKQAFLPGGETRVTPEYEDCRRIAREYRIPVRKVYEDVIVAAVKEKEKAGQGLRAPGEKV